MSNTYKFSNNERIKKSFIDNKIKQAKANFILSCLDDGTHYCWICGAIAPLSVSHIVSVNDCQKQGKSEETWNIENFELLCIPCHQKFEANKTLNKKREAYIDKYFPELKWKYEI